VRACGRKPTFRWVILHRKSRGCGVARLHRQWTVIVSDSVSLLVRKIIEKVVDVFERLLILEFRDAIAEVYPEVVSDIFS